MVFFHSLFSSSGRKTRTTAPPISLLVSDDTFSSSTTSSAPTLAYSPTGLASMWEKRRAGAAGPHSVATTASDPPSDALPPSYSSSLSTYFPSFFDATYLSRGPSVPSPSFLSVSSTERTYGLGSGAGAARRIGNKRSRLALVNASSSGATLALDLRADGELLPSYADAMEVKQREEVMRKGRSRERRGMGRMAAV